MTQIGIIGGGIIGLACAWRLCRDGHQVILCESNAESAAATWAAAGMLAPHNEAQEAGPLWRLCAQSLDAWPSFIARLQVAPAAVDFRVQGSLIPELNVYDGVEIAVKEAWCLAQGVGCERWDKQRLQQSEPALSTACRSALFMPAAQVDPRRVTQLLRQRCAEHGVIFADRVVACADRELRCASGARYTPEIIVCAAGAWTPGLAQLLGVPLHGEPIKGQMLSFAADPGLTRFVHSQHAYCVPRAGTGLIIGATMERAGFDSQDDAQAIARLANGARLLLPQLHNAAIAETWTGLRPRLAGGYPCIARVNPHLIIATGHFRNGILLTPVTAALVAALVAGENPSELAPFSLAAHAERAHGNDDVLIRS